MARLIVRGLNAGDKERLRDSFRRAYKRDEPHSSARFEGIGLKPNEMIEELRGTGIQTPVGERQMTIRR